VALSWIEIAVLISLFSGIILAIARLYEPFYRYLVWKEIKSWFGSLVSEKQKKNLGDIQKNPAMVLLSAQLSIELVYSILVAITEHTVGETKSSDWKKY